MTKELRELCTILQGANVTFSANCVSGLTSACHCWRCLGVEPEQEDPEWAADATVISEA